MGENEKKIKRITGITVSNLPEGKRLTYTFCVLDSEGNTLESNGRGTFVILDEEVSAAADKLFAAATAKSASESN